MKKQILILAFGLWCNLGYAQQKNAEQLATPFDKILSEQFKANETGATALVSRNGQVIYKKAFGMADLELNVPMQVDNVFRIGSITKQFTAVAILQLMEQGKLNLQDEVTRFIPDYPTQGNKITIEHLLTHTSGIQSYTNMADFVERMTLDLKPTEIIDHFKNQPMRFAPGTKWEYSNSNYFLLGYIIEKITGKPYSEYLDQHFFKPLGMTNSLYGSDAKIVKNRAGAYTKGGNGFENAMPLSMTQPYASGAIQSTVVDLFKWHQAVHSYKLVKKESLDKAFTNHKLNDRQATDYGYGWRLKYIQGSATIEHSGGINGFLTTEIYLPKEDVFVAVFSNCECNPTEDIASKLAAEAIGQPYVYKEIPVEKTALEDYAGVYENEKSEQRIISVSENQLYSQRGRNQKFMAKAYEKDKFFLDDAILTIAFARNKTGEVEKLTTQSRSGNEVWLKTNKPIPTKVEITVSEKILEAYVGEYVVTPKFSFVITREQAKMFVQATAQPKFEIFPEAETKFFLKVVDADLEFVKDESGKVTKAVLTQGGRTMDAKKIK